MAFLHRFDKRFSRQKLSEIHLRGSEYKFYCSICEAFELKGRAETETWLFKSSVKRTWPQHISLTKTNEHWSAQRGSTGAVPVELSDVLNEIYADCMKQIIELRKELHKQQWAVASSKEWNAPTKIGRYRERGLYKEQMKTAFESNANQTQKTCSELADQAPHCAVQKPRSAVFWANFGLWFFS